MALIKTLILVTLLGVVCSVSYEGYKVYKVTTKTQTENAYFKALLSHPDFDIWSKLNIVGVPITIMVAPKAQKGFERYLAANKMEYDVIIDNVQRTIDAEKEYHRKRPALESGRISFDQYLRHSEMNAYLEQLAADYPDIVTLDTLGQSYQQRDMKLIRISSGISDPPKPVIFLDAGIHAREWIAPAVALYLINQLVENADNSGYYQDVDWIILPSLNPDGYEFSWEEDRFWRKTVSPGTECDGCDANRNFDFHWMESGADSYECSEIYAGKEPFSEIETRNLRDYLNKTENLQAYLTLHSFGEALLYPWGYDAILCDNWMELDDLARAMAIAINAVSTRGTEYTIGNTAIALYPAAGGSDDWAMSAEGITLVYTIELPGGGSFGFDLPPNEIQGLVEETFEGLKVFAYYVARNRR